MTEGSDPQNTATQSESEPIPYPPSWLDRLIGWIRRLPGPTWLSYSVLFVVVALLNHTARWIDGSLQPGTLDVTRLAEVPLIIFLLPYTHYLNNVASKSLSEIRPILEVTEPQFSNLQYELTTLPRRSGLFSIAIGFPVAALSVLASPTSWGFTESPSLLMIIFPSVIAAIAMVLTTTFLFHTVHQLRIVDRLQTMPVEISLFQTGPVYALSSLTVRTGIGIVMIVYYYVFMAYSVKVFGPLPPMSVVDLTIFGILLLVAVASFIIPLSRMHDRLVKEKARMLAEANMRIELTVKRLHEQVDSGSLDNADGLNKNLASLLLEAETLGKASTWPWKPETLRGFLGAVTLPVLVWLITTALGRFF